MMLASLLLGRGLKMTSETWETLQNSSHIAAGGRHVKRTWRLKRLLEQIRQSPRKLGELKGSPHSTLYRDIDFLKGLGVVKKLDDGRLAWIDYSLLEEEIVKKIEEHRRLHRANPTIAQLAISVGKPPENPELREALYAVAKKTERWAENWGSWMLDPNVRESLERELTQKAKEKGLGTFDIERVKSSLVQLVTMPQAKLAKMSNEEFRARMTEIQRLLGADRQ